MAGGKRKLSPAPDTPTLLDHRITEISARHEIEPYNQGQLDGLCGLYSSINAIRLALHGHRNLRKADANRLFHVGIDYLDRKGGLADAVMHGMGIRRWRAIAGRLAASVSKDDIHVELQRAEFASTPTIADLLAWIDDSLAQGMPVLLHMNRALNHYSVVCASTPTSLHLFDSYGLRFVRRTSCGIGSGSHHLTAKGLMRVAVRRRR